MNKNQQQFILLLLLGGVLSFIWWRQLQPATQPATMPTLPETPSMMPTSLTTKKKLVYNGVTRDPLLSPIESVAMMAGTNSSKSVTLPLLTVQGMLWGVEREMCIINGKIFSVGDTVEGARILEIKREGIVLLYQDKTFTLVPKGGDAR